LLRAFNAENRGDFARALQLIDQAAEIMPLQSWFRVKRATLLLRLERVEDAHRAFDALRQEFKGSSDPNRQYLRHYCTAMLSLMQLGSGQWSYEAKQANAIKGSWRVKGLLPMVSVDDIHDNIKPRR
jgi:tetratricopeptide (TPR) repeat protein